jgi:hypothetical protein
VFLVSAVLAGRLDAPARTAAAASEIAPSVQFGGAH